MSETQADPVSQSLDAEIEALHVQVANLKQQLRIQATNLLTSESIHRALLSLSPPSTTSSQADHSTDLSPVSKVLATHFAEQQTYDQQSLYRICASITSFQVLDPDPHAVDHGKVFGLRFEVMVSARFLRPYYVLLNRPWTSAKPSSKAWRVHKHTAPPAIPLSGLAARFLPPPPFTTRGPHEEQETTRTYTQDLSGFAKALRREIFRYHNRVAAIADVRKASRVSQNNALQELGDGLIRGSKEVTSILEIGRVIVDDDGNVKQAAVFADGVPDLATAQRLAGGGQTIKLEDLIGKLDDPPEEPLIEGETLGV
ncbi:hypothetical protein HOO65_070154 [Ceratocystis lukuohia]|uniref:Cenp-O kinetochore centromere component n=1 Tax=Ceratocystis lukuohia TaxID=2019550 RepID=A0ABR4MBP8_9PEZI